MSPRALYYSRVAYAVFVVLGLLYFPARIGFRLEPRACGMAIDAELVIVSLSNVAHVVLFGVFFIITNLQFRQSERGSRRAIALSALAALAMGALVELAQGITGNGNCRLRDLIPDAIGIALAAGLVTFWHRALRHLVVERP